ncbi:MAG: hypothetical protein KJ056_03975 [Acidimicrobiia bacterium]|nr:hypothetical protein [Acidimicrobiia bacterium]
MSERGPARRSTAVGAAPGAVGGRRRSGIRPPAPLALLTAAVLAALVLAACNGGGDSPATSSTAAPSTASTTRPSTSTTGGGTTGSSTGTTAPAGSPDTDVACDAPGSTRDQESADRPAPPVWLLTDVRTSRCDGKDRIVFEFRPVAGAPDATPPYEVEYEDPPFRDSGAGRETVVLGNRFLEVELHPAAIADLDQESAPLTYSGPRSIEPDGLDFVRQVALFDAFEGYVKWAVGLDESRPFRVQAATDPPRVVVDIG